MEDVSAVIENQPAENDEPQNDSLNWENFDENAAEKQNAQDVYDLVKQ